MKIKKKDGGFQKEQAYLDEPFYPLPKWEMPSYPSYL